MDPKAFIPMRIAYWLIPAEPTLSEYQKVVTNLGQQFNGPEFVPHVTIYVGTSAPEEQLELILESLADFGEVELEPMALEFSDKFTQSCFIKFENSEKLSEMCELVRRQVRIPENYSVEPHMSLFYGSLSLSDQKLIQQGLILPRKMSSNVVSAISSQRRTVCGADVEAWREVGRRCLGQETKLSKT